MIIWKKIEPILKDSKIDISSLTPNLCNDDNQMIPHLLEQLGDKVVILALEGIGCPIFDVTMPDDIVSSSSNMLIVKEKDTGKKSVFLTNPYNKTLRFQAENKLGKNPAKYGFISRQDIGNIKVEDGNDSKTKKSSKDHAGLLNKILKQAAFNDVSDIHITPRNNKNIAIKFRQFGEIVESGEEDIPMSNYASFANILLEQADNNGGEYKHYIEAQFEYKANGINLTIRLQLNPTILKFDDNEGNTVPSFVLRIHNNANSNTHRSIDTIGFLPEQKNALENIAQYNSGVIIVSGPTGSGKTTALYAILMSAISKRDRVVKTIEDPVEIVIDNPLVCQTNINPKAEITYEATLNGSILRSDVDVALIGEIRSEDTARGVIDLDRVGHLILATVHTKKTSAIIDRMRQFGISNSDISDALSAILSTRLVKKVCPHCSNKSEPIKDLREKAYGDLEAMNDGERAASFHCKKILEDLGVARGSKYTGSDNIQLLDCLAIINKNGCNKCVNGYNGREMVAEVWIVDNTMRAMINANKPNSEIEAHVISQKNKSIWSHGFDLVKEGRTTIAALELVLPGFASFGNNYSADESNQI